MSKFTETFERIYNKNYKFLLVLTFLVFAFSLFFSFLKSFIHFLINFSFLIVLFIFYSKIRGDWTYYEDFVILNFACFYGSKWSKISKILNDRTEHSVKNRFFSILSNCMQIPIRKIKRNIDYLNKKLLAQIILFYNFQANAAMERTIETSAKYRSIHSKYLC